MADLTPDSSRPDIPSSVTDLLERTTPERLAPLDLDHLARRGRRRHRRQRAVRGAGVVAAVVVLATGVVSLTRDGGGSEVGTAGSPALTEAVGSWTQAADPPFAPRGGAFGGTLSDGRVLLWGGQLGSSDEPALDGGIYDPATGQWTTIAAAPLPALTTLSPHFVATALTDDRLAVAGTSRTDGRVVAAVYDVAEQGWYQAPPVEGLGELFHDSLVWDGETLVLVTLGDGTGPPVLRRWQPADDRWTTGATPPASLHADAGTASDGERLAMWGPTSTGTEGAIYHVAEDRWETLPAVPLPGRLYATVVWSDGRLVVGGGTATVENPSSNVPDMAAYDPATSAWETLDGPPEGGIASEPHAGCACFDDGRYTFVVANPGRPVSGDEPLWYLGDAGWEQAPLRVLHRVGGVVVALSDLDFRGEHPFALQVRVERGQWLAAAEAPFGGRMSPTVVATGDQLLVVGGLRPVPVAGQSAADMQPYGDAWVFDLSG